MGQATCTFTAMGYSDSTCTTEKREGRFENGEREFKLQHDKCYEVPGVYTGSSATYVKWAVCDPTSFLAFANYADDGCTNLVTDSHPIEAYVTDDCIMYNENTWVKMSSLANTGNKFGINAAQGYLVFFCESLLYGLCKGN